MKIDLQVSLFYILLLLLLLLLLFCQVVKNFIFKVNNWMIEVRIPTS
jgi:hypothetical protein